MDTVLALVRSSMCRLRLAWITVSCKFARTCSYAAIMRKFVANRVNDGRYRYIASMWLEHRPPVEGDFLKAIECVMPQCEAPPS